MRALTPQKSSTKQRYGGSETKEGEDGIDSNRHTRRYDSILQSHKGYGAEKYRINHSFHSTNSKAHSDCMHLSRLKKNKDKKCFEGYIIALSGSMP